MPNNLNLKETIDREFDEFFGDADFIRIYKLSKTKNKQYNTKDSIKDFICLFTTSLLQEKCGQLQPYLGHDKNCIREQFSAGRPTKSGGYEQKFDGKWYQVKPIDKTPKCNCGLADIIKSDN